MSEAPQMVDAFLAVLADPDGAAWETLFTADVSFRDYTPAGVGVMRGLATVRDHLLQIFSAADTLIERLSRIEAADRISIEFRHYQTLAQRYTETFYAAFLQIRDDRIHTLDIYSSVPIPSAHRQDWIAPPSLTPEEIVHLFEEWEHSFDIREFVPPNFRGQGNMQQFIGGSGNQHPGSNSVAAVRWPAEIADQKIEETIAYFRSRDIGFSWFLSPFDQPSDLPQRLERHGLILAGDDLIMTRTGLEPHDIPTNPEVEIELIDGSRDASIEDVLEITARCFDWTPQQMAERRLGYYERLMNPELRKTELLYLARREGQPLAFGRVSYRCGVAFLTGAGTLPEARNQKVYSTLLARRLAAAHERGYHIAGILAGPMSRRVVSKYGFKPYGKVLVYGWMPEPDMAIIKSLVPQE
ncbi:MAG: hypothetical protein EXR62_10935 [Chloroflexi bacterium]|nr:hypothetical protein [Chloroflexota bacterium]